MLIVKRGVKGRGNNFSMLCCLLSALLAGNLAIAGRVSLSLMRRPGPLAAIGLLIAGAVSIAIAPAVAQHGQHYAARAAAHHRSVIEEILAQPLCSGEVGS